MAIYIYREYIKRIPDKRTQNVFFSLRAINELKQQSCPMEENVEYKIIVKM